MAEYRKLGRPTDQRMALIRNQVSDLLWKGRIETTYEKAQEVRREAEKIITLAIRSYKDTVTVTKTVNQVEVVKVKGSKEKQKVVTRVEKEFINDGAKKLAARRRIMAFVMDRQEERLPDETKTAYKMRTGDINHPLVEKIFNELAPKYAKRAEELGQGGGYTRVIKLGARRGDNAEMAIVELV
ncbi:MAG: 50S ribosomal protein L17 [Clostridia bacterium]|nr:50S ribosomal protein L17 [Clostridia bacterium]